MRYKYEGIPDAVKRIVVWQLQHYQEDKRSLEAARNLMISIPIQTYGGKLPTKRTERRPTEQTAIRILSEPYLNRLETNLKACDDVIERLDPVDLRLVELMYWKPGETITSTCAKVYLEKSAVYQRLNKILGGVAIGMGYLSP